MSFFSSIRGFGRTNKKNKATAQQQSNIAGTQPPASIYSASRNGSAISLARTQSPSKQSIKSSRQRQQSRQQLQQQQQLQQKQQQQQQQAPKPPLFVCEPFVKTALVKGSFKTIVQAPKYVDHGEWLALNVFETFTHLNQFYGVIAEYVTVDQYPTMRAGPDTEYLWYDNNNRPISLPASQYIDLALSWISQKLNDQHIFPTKSGLTFPSNFLKDIRNICKQMFRIFAHIFYNHFDKILHLSIEAHWNSFFAHFISFVKEFELIERAELEPLLPLIENLEAQGKIY